MVMNIRVSRDFATASVDDLANLVDDVVNGITGNAAFPTPPVTVAALTTLNTTFRAAVTAAHLGGPTQTAERDNVYDTVVAALRKNANYVENQSNNNVATLLSSGFDIVSTNRASAPLDQPFITEISNLATTKLLIRLDSILNAKSYQVQMAMAANGPWSEAGIYTQARRIVLMGLTPGTIYFVRVRAIGGSTGYSDWSVAVSLMCT